MKKTTLKFIQFAWVLETIVILIFTMMAIVLLSQEKISSWLQFIPIFSLLIGAQGTAAGIGPLASDYINKNNKEKTGE